MDFQVTMEEANAERPKKPESVDPQRWLNYWEDVACFMATQADRRKFGIKETKHES